MLVERWDIGYDIPKEQIAMITKEYLGKQELPSTLMYKIKIMLRDRSIISISDYRKMVEANEVDPSNVYVYINLVPVTGRPYFCCQYIFYPYMLIQAILSKLEFDIEYHGVVPATGLIYLTTVEYYIDNNWRRRYLAIDIVNLLTVINNLNLHNMVRKLGYNTVAGEILYQQLEKELQNRFGRLSSILFDFHYRGDMSRKEEAERIIAEYNKVFQPYTVCYDLSNEKEVDCSSLESN